MSKTQTAIHEIMEEVIAIRRDLHRHPEMGKNEVRTSKIIREKLAAYGVDEIEQPCPTAVTGLIFGQRREGKCIALRADIDALPITEETGLPYASQTPGMMHACGHDMHTAMLLGAAKILCDMRDQFAGCIKLIFQHSEDTLPGGAKELVEQGVMDNPRVDAIFGMHILPDETRMGQIGLRAGALTTSVDLFDVTITGTGGHGSAPHTTNDPILAACQMIVLLQQIVSRRVNPLETAIFSIGSIHSGDAPNIIPGEVLFSGIARCYHDEVRNLVVKQTFDIARGIEAISGCEVNINHYDGYPSIYNDSDLIALADTAIKAELGGEAVVHLPVPMSFSEDFSYYTKMTGVPCAFLLLFGGHIGEFVSLHNSKCAMHEEAMPKGIAALISTAVAFLNDKK